MKSIILLFALVILFYSCNEQDCCGQQKAAEYEEKVSVSQGTFSLENDYYVSYGWEQSTEKIDSFSLYLEPSLIRIAQKRNFSFGFIRNLQATPATPSPSLPKIDSLKIFATDTIVTADSAFFPQTNLATLFNAGNIKDVALQDYIDSLKSERIIPELLWLGLYFNQRIEPLENVKFYVDLKSIDEGKFIDSTEVIEYLE